VDALEVWHPSQDAAARAEIVESPLHDHSPDLRYLGTASPSVAAAAAALERLEVAWRRQQAASR
jgi:hypothetical protein